MAAGRRIVPPALADLPRFLFAGLFGYAVYNALFTFGLDRTSVFSVALLVSLGPIFTLLLAALLRTDRVRLGQWVGVALATAGVALFVMAKSRAAGPYDPSGDLLSLLAAFLFAAYSLATRPLVARYGAAPATAWSALIGLACILPLAWPSVERQDWAGLSFRSWGSLFYASAISMLAGYTLWTWAIDRRGAARTAPYLFLIPIVTGALAALVFGERLGPVELAGATLVLAGTAIVRLAAGGPAVRVDEAASEASSERARPASNRRATRERHDRHRCERRERGEQRAMTYAIRREGEPVRLAEIATTPRGVDKHDAERRFAALLDELEDLQELLYAAGAQALLVVLQGMDTSGKDGAIRHVFASMDPQGVRVASFKQPTPLEQAHDFLWRVHKQVPEHGMAVVFNRSHYEGVIVERVKEIVPVRVWEARYAQINAFEELLVDSGTILVKCFLHISRDEQADRLRARERDVEKAWKLDPGDWQERARWEAYMAAYDEALTRCATPQAPWFIVPADKKWFRDLAVAQAVADALRPHRDAWLASLRVRSERELAAIAALRDGGDGDGGENGDGDGDSE